MVQPWKLLMTPALPKCVFALLSDTKLIDVLQFSHSLDCCFGRTVEGHCDLTRMNWINKISCLHNSSIHCLCIANDAFFYKNTPTVNMFLLFLQLPFYCAMLCRAQLCHSMFYPSVTFRYHDHIGWNTSKLIHG